MKLVDLTGRTFGNLTVLGRAPNTSRHTQWLCRCACGAKPKPVQAHKLLAGLIVSCGCNRAARLASGVTHRSHGQSETREYQSWMNMRRRCEDPNNPAYPRYGGRGITVSRQFRTFEGFIGCLGPCPAGFTLERMDNAKGYTPSNTVWAHPKAQGRNKRNNQLLTFDGKTQPLSAWAEDLGITDGSLRTRLERWTLEKALSLRRTRNWPPRKLAP